MSGIRAGVVEEACASDWGLWRTLTANLEALDGYPGLFDPSGEQHKRWYELPEEVRGDHDL